MAQDVALGLTLWHLDAPLVSSRTDITGLYPNDSWSGKQVTFTRQHCRGGTLAVALRERPGVVHGRADGHGERERRGGRARARTAARLGGHPRAARAATAARARVVFDVAETRVPAEVTNGENGDTRELGVHFRNFNVAP